MTKQIISKNGKIVCTTFEPYDKDTIKSMKQSGYKIKECKNEKVNNYGTGFQQKNGHLSEL